MIYQIVTLRAELSARVYTESEMAVLPTRTGVCPPPSARVLGICRRRWPKESGELHPLRRVTDNWKPCRADSRTIRGPMRWT